MWVVSVKAKCATRRFLSFLWSLHYAYRSHWWTNFDNQYVII